MRFDDPFFLFQFLPALLAFYFLTRAASASAKATADKGRRRSMAGPAEHAALAIVAAAGVIVLWWSPVGGLLVACVAVAVVAAHVIGRLTVNPARRVPARLLAALCITGSLALLAYIRYRLPAAAFALSGAVVVIAHVVSYLADVARGQASARQPLHSALYLVQFPLFPAGPLIRFRDFSASLPKLATFAGLGSFTYGVRRVIIGWVKVDLVAGILARPVDAVFALPPSRLSAGVAWLAATCAALEFYYRFSGYADFAIGLGRMLGFRYPENFRRPYTADSIREFWRRWSVTTIIWLRDHLSLPIAGRDVPTPGLFANMVIGFVLLGLWHGGGSTTFIWALYTAGWLALEAVWLSPIVERMPRVLRHVYVLLVVVVGWLVLRGPGVAPLLNVLQAMAGFAEGGRLAYPASRYIDWPVGTALFVAIIGAGPLVPWISRWRVTLDATTAAIVMMVSAFWVFVWRPAAMVKEAIRPRRP